jgi:hypothetical protein
VRRVPRLLLVLVAAVVVAAVGVAVYVTQPTWPDAPVADVRDARVSPAALEEHVRMLAVTLAPRDWTRTDNLDRAARYVAGHLAASGARVSEQVYVAMKGEHYRNVIGSFGPDGGERVIVGAHYDGVLGVPAADDNASGVAGLLELARLLGRTARLPRRVDLVAFTLEEEAYSLRAMGSWVHAASLRDAGAAVRGMIALDMIGYFADGDGSQSYPARILGLLYPSRGDYVAVVGRLGGARLVRRVKAAMAGASALPVRSINAPRAIPGIDFSDHRSFWDHDYPAVLVTDTAFYRNPHYHEPSDTPDTLDYRRMADVVRGLYAAVLAVSQ